jgi:hypothetical protein
MKKQFLTPINPVVPKKPRKAVVMYGMNPPDKIESLPREVIKWIQSLDLTYSVKNIKKDFNNGFLVAQILSRYYPVTNNQAANFKAMQMHTISNELSMKARRDNWTQINKFLIKINEVNTRIDDMETFIKNENGEILLFIISLYQELTKRHIPLLEGKVISTDVDNINKSFLLKDNGEIEKLKKNDIEILAKGLKPGSEQQPKPKQEIQEQKNDESKEDKKEIEDLGKTSKTNNSFLSRTTNNVVMKGDVKPMAAQPAQAEKGFKIKISEPKPYVAQTRTILQPRDNNFRTNVNQPQQNKTDNDIDAFANYNSLYQNDRDIEQKANSVDNPFLKLGEPLMNNIKSDFPEDFKKINIIDNTKFFTHFFEAIEDISDEALTRVIDTVLKIIQDFYNILSGRQVNDYIDVFLIMFNAYINLEINLGDDNKKASILHEGLCNFFIKSLKNKNEEMFFIFKNIFIKKIFETINDKEHSFKVKDLCDLLYRILDPSFEQQIDLFKMFREHTKNNEEIMYECFAKLHEKINNLNESLIDACLFYVLNGLTSENPKIRYHSLQMLLKYATNNVNFVYNFAPKIEKLSKKEKDRENCLLLIKIVCQTFKNAYNKKTQPKETKKSNTGGNNNLNNNNNLEKEKKNAEDKPEKNEQNNQIGEIDQAAYLQELTFGNKIIKNITERFIGDNIFVLIFVNYINDYLYDNNDLYLILITSFFDSNESIMEYELFGGELDDTMKSKYSFTNFRSPFVVKTMTGFNPAMILKAFDTMVQQRQYKELGDREYNLINFIVKDGLNINFSDIYKSSFNFSGLVIQDISKVERCNNCFSILEAFLECGPIQKSIFDEWYDNLNKVFNKVFNSEGEENNVCRDTIKEFVNRWINDMKISQIVRDDIKKLAEVIPKEQEQIKEENI